MHQRRIQDLNIISSGCHWTHWPFKLLGSKFNICTYFILCTRSWSALYAYVFMWLGREFTFTYSLVNFWRIVFLCLVVCIMLLALLLWHARLVLEVQGEKLFWAFACCICFIFNWMLFYAGLTLSLVFEGIIQAILRILDHRGLFTLPQNGNLSNFFIKATL